MRHVTCDMGHVTAELDWEEERASLVSAELDSLHLGQRHGPADGVASSCNPVAGFTLAPLGSGQRNVDNDPERGRAGSRLGRLGQIVEKINCNKWGPAGGDGVEPLKELADSVGDRTLDCSAEDYAAPNSPHSPKLAGADGMHWRYLGALYRILQSIITPLHSHELSGKPGGLDAEQRERLLVRGSMHHLHTQFRGEEEDDDQDRLKA